MITVIFHYEGQKIDIQFESNEKLGKVLNNFITNQSVSENEAENVFFLYDGQIIQEEEKEKTLNELLLKKEEKPIIAIIVYKEEKNKDQDCFIKPNYFICPICKGSARIMITNYKIKTFECPRCDECKSFKDIPFDEFQNKQKINESKIICMDCKVKNKNEAFQKKFHKCLKCKKDICILCKDIHHKDHSTIDDYYKKDFICEIHNKKFEKYCKVCQKNLCHGCKCDIEHDGNVIKKFTYMIKSSDDLEEGLKRIKSSIDGINYYIEENINKLNFISKKLTSLYDIYEEMINNYRSIKDNYYNYQVLLNLELIQLSKNDILKELSNLNKSKDINEILKLYDKMLRKKGTQVLKGGENYIGEMKNNIPDGDGEYFINNEVKYEGKIKNGKKDGKGKLISIKGDILECEFKNDEIAGVVKYEMKNGNIFEGDKNGKGKFVHKNGEKYEGNFKDGKAHGYGIFHFRNGDRYEGNWENNKINGKGIYYFKNGNKFEGYFDNIDFKDFKLNGEGVMYYFNDNENSCNKLGDIIIGKWENNKIKDKGFYFYKNGNIFIGGLKNNDFNSLRKEGKGIKISENNEFEFCNFENDQLKEKLFYFNFNFN